MSFYSTGIGGARQECADCIKQALYAFVLERRAQNHRYNFHREGSLADSALDFVDGDCAGIVEIFCHEIVVEFGNLLEHFVAPLFGFSLERCGDILYAVVGTHGFVVPEDGLHLNEVDNALESFLGADRNLNGAGICSEHILELAYYFEEVSTRAVHLVYVADTGNVV